MNESPTLSRLPLWQLLLELDRAERALGPKAETTLLIGRMVLDRLERERKRERTTPKGGAA